MDCPICDSIIEQILRLAARLEYYPKGDDLLDGAYLVLGAHIEADHPEQMSAEGGLWVQ